MTRRSKRAPVAIEPRQRLPVGPGPASDSVILDFGHHAGRTIEELVTVDPDYLAWLAGHPSGARYRAEIDRVLTRLGDRSPGSVESHRR